MYASKGYEKEAKVNAVYQLEVFRARMNADEDSKKKVEDERDILHAQEEQLTESVSKHFLEDKCNLEIQKSEVFRRRIPVIFTTDMSIYAEVNVMHGEEPNVERALRGGKSCWRQIGGLESCDSAGG